ncbi:MAG: hypothetical protein IPK63_07440 [Candidatus Competibacteraceae bacterium]|nr:hypothetical protein [Candidatus Competibacteraceae bacterium]
MKVNVSVEATAQEMREFLGLPNIQPLHDDVLQTLRDNVQRGAISFDSFNQFFKPLLPTQLHSLDLVQKFWEAVAKASNTSKESGGIKESTDKKANGLSEPASGDAPRNRGEKSS